MAHELTPKIGQQHLSPGEVVRRLRNAFRYVDASGSRGAASIEEMIGYMLEARRAGAAFSEEELERLRSVKNEAIDVIVADQLEHGLVYLSALVQPDERLFIGYQSGQHEDAAKPLLERVAQVLDYNVELV
jgi:hypothetical protein